MFVEPRSTASILHADLDSFFASVEQRDDPSLRGLPVVVGGGVVLAASYEAKAYGVRTAMGGRLARELCPQAIVVSPRFDAYTEASRAVYEVFRDTTPLVEGVSIDEAFLDVAGLARLSGTPEQIGVRLRAEVLARTGLPITVGVARTKFLAKMASRAAKPDGLLVVPPEGERAFLHPLPVEQVWGVGDATATRLHRYGLRHVRDVVDVPADTLVRLLGAQGRLLHSLVQGRDPRPVEPGRRRRAIGSQRALGRRPRTASELDATLTTLVDRVTRRMRTAGRTGRTVVLRLRFDDFTRATRSRTVPRPTDDTQLLLTVARLLFAEAQPMIRERGLTLLGISVGNLDDSPDRQLELPFPGHALGELDGTIDQIRDRFGSALVTRGALVGRDPGMAVPLLPD